jgi:colanic acid/amylovoran biosynthesis glycosyltransferase
MKIGYLINTYPTTSQTFIHREIRALEADGMDIARYSIRRWTEPLVDPDSKAEEQRTQYILSSRAGALLSDFLRELFTNPIGVARACATGLRLTTNAGGDIIRHAAYIFEAATLKRWAKRDGVRHIHAHFSNNPAAVAMLCHRMGGPPFSFTAHGPDEFDNWGTTSLAEKVRGARFVVAISHFCRVQLARAAGMAQWEKLHIVRCGLDLKEFKQHGASANETTTFVCVGRLCPQKAQTLIVDAVHIVAKRFPQVRVIMVGDGETRPDIEARISDLGVQQQVTLLGWRSNAEVRSIMANAKALLTPSFAEGLPIVIMESLALRRPVITTFIAGIPELVDQHCGWIIPAGSVEHIAQAMIDAIETPRDKLESLGHEGNRRVNDLHDVTKNARALRALFTSPN